MHLVWTVRRGGRERSMEWLIRRPEHAGAWQRTEAAIHGLCDFDPTKWRLGGSGHELDRA